ncbi:cytochrome P450 [Streptomyces sp. NPDC097704]|uniref:cytochrome P450 n=1 Tax=Streptomyces sp. NPDC097704 TaxID=3157101 RepID=UPI00333488FE
MTQTAPATHASSSSSVPGPGCPHLARLTADFDAHDPHLTPDLAVDVHRAIRTATPVAHSQAHGGTWIVSRYQDVRAALADHETFSSASGVFFPRASGTPRFAPLEYDPPEQNRFRAAMKPPFQLSRVRELHGALADLVRAHVTPIAERGHGDLVAELAVPLPLAVVGLAVGFTEHAQHSIRELTSNTWARMPKDDGPGGFWPAFAALFDGEIRRAREQPGDDYLSTLVRLPFDGRPATREELHVMLVAYAIAGHETSMNTLAHLLWQLGRQPELQSALRRDPGLVPAAVEEALRLWTPVDHGTRVTTRPVVVSGTEIPAGARVVLLTGAANRDPGVFPDPDAFRLDRGVNRHLTFGHGIHFCLGAHLAREEFAQVLHELLRHPEFTLTENPTRYFENGRHICLDRLPVRFASRT